MSTEMQKHVFSQAEVAAASADRPIVIFERADPEVTIAAELRRFFDAVAFADVYPNFGSVRIGVVHPFGLLLLQLLNNQPLDVNVFPSITVMDAVENESFELLAKNVETVLFSATDVEYVRGQVVAKRLIGSIANVDRLAAIVNASGSVVGRKTTLITTHSVTLDIWGENKDVVSVLYDAVKAFLTTELLALHELGFDSIGAVQGSRSGDVNVEFGTVLYGARVTIPVTTAVASIQFLPVEGLVESIAGEGTFHIADEEE